MKGNKSDENKLIEALNLGPPSNYSLKVY